jgi:hypothetical protein
MVGRFGAGGREVEVGVGGARDGAHDNTKPQQLATMQQRHASASDDVSVSAPVPAPRLTKAAPPPQSNTRVFAVGVGIALVLGAAAFLIPRLRMTAAAFAGAALLIYIRFLVFRSEPVIPFLGRGMRSVLAGGKGGRRPRTGGPKAD